MQNKYTTSANILVVVVFFGAAFEIGFMRLLLSLFRPAAESSFGCQC